jgi:hypothetical protein
VTRALAAAVVLLATAAAPARAQPDAGADQDPRLLFTQGRYAAAAERFEQRWRQDGGAADADNAVVAWRTAGRYARARALLVRVRERTPLDGSRAERAALLDERLGQLTGTIVVDGAIPADAVLAIDGDPPERIGERIVVDLGDHELTIERDGCDPFQWQGLVAPGSEQRVKVALRCPERGTLHVVLVGERAARLQVDGTLVRVDGERELDLAPGPHRLRLEHRGRLLVDETVDVRNRSAATRRIPFPWRARRGGIYFAAASTAIAGGAGALGGLGLAVGWSGARFRAGFTAGTAWTTARGIGCTYGPPCSHPWAGLELAAHLFPRPRWQSRPGRRQASLEIDPLAIRFDQIRQQTYFGGITPWAPYNEPAFTHIGFLPITVTAELGWLHLEAVLWPIGISRRRFPREFAPPEDPGGETEHGLGATLAISGAWMPWP